MRQPGDQNQPLEAVRAELGRFGVNSDTAHEERPSRMLNVARDTGEFLSVLVWTMVARPYGKSIAVKQESTGSI